ncbi:MAG: zinc ABC transporter substrate-binding protein [Verrucomicrobia bacterium]|nr:zinc ABC transporter substrate-binding protein [Verrucomicrobiota bacterium]
MKLYKFLFSLLLLLFSCQSSERPADVLVTTAPYATFTQRIAGDLLKVEVLVPPGTNPHIYEPTPKQVERILGVHIWFRLGETIETRVLGAMEENNPQLIVVDLTKGFGLRHEGEEGLDRHLWMSPKLAMEQSKIIAQTLEETYPEHKEKFQNGLGALLKDLEALDLQLTQQLAPIKGQAMLVSHPAFGYFCEEFGLEQLSVEVEGKDPLPQDIENMLQTAQKNTVRAVFILPEYNNKGAILIAEKLGLPVYEIDPYAANYFETMQTLGNLLAKSN